MPPQLLRKYIGYARTYVAPRLSAEAGQVLRAFYLELRRQSAVADGLPVTVCLRTPMVQTGERSVWHPAITIDFQLQCVVCDVDAS